MPESKTTVVRIERGKFTPFFQVARAHLSAASALLTINKSLAVEYIRTAARELTELADKIEGTVA